MTSFNSLMTDHHKHCDDLFSKAENSVSNGNWEEAQTHWKSFHEELLDHIDNKEEGTIFPEVEKTLGPIGPIMVMKQEHEQMRRLSNELSQALAEQDKNGFLAQSESLMILIQQHNMKEEQILYPLIEQSIPDAEELVS